MGLKQKLLLSIAVMILFSLGALIVFGDNGLSELNRLKRELAGIIGENEEVSNENLSLYQEIDRLKNDYEYIENVARDQLGVIKRDEVIIKVKENGKK